MTHASTSDTSTVAETERGCAGMAPNVAPILPLDAAHGRDAVVAAFGHASGLRYWGAQTWLRSPHVERAVHALEAFVRLASPARREAFTAPFRAALAAAPIPAYSRALLEEKSASDSLENHCRESWLLGHTLAELRQFERALAAEAADAETLYRAVRAHREAREAAESRRVGRSA